MEMVAEAKVLIVEMVCDKCKQGVMVAYNGFSSLQYYPHKCDKCGHKESYTCRYPYHKLVPIEPLREPAENEISGRDI